jgi:hypothetical protein
LATFDESTSAPNRKFDEQRQADYLEHRAKGCGPLIASSNVGVTYQTVKNFRREFPEFKVLEREAEERSIQKIENALFRTAEGGNVRAQEFFLKNRKPKKWNDTQSITAKVAGMTDEELLLHAKRLFAGIAETGSSTEDDDDTAERTSSENAEIPQ